jgi:hypothetical protein
MKTKIYHERKGSEKARAEVEAMALGMVLKENEKYYREQLAGYFLIKDLRKERGNPKGLVASL